MRSREGDKDSISGISISANKGGWQGGKVGSSGSECGRRTGGCGRRGPTSAFCLALTAECVGIHKPPEPWVSLPARAGSRRRGHMCAVGQGSWDEPERVGGPRADWNQKLGHIDLGRLLGCCQVQVASTGVCIRPRHCSTAGREGSREPTAPSLSIKERERNQGPSGTDSCRCGGGAGSGAWQQAPPPLGYICVSLAEPLSSVCVCVCCGVSISHSPDDAVKNFCSSCLDRTCQNRAAKTQQSRHPSKARNVGQGRPCCFSLKESRDLQP